MRLPPLPADQWDDAARHAVAAMLPEERRNPDDAGTRCPRWFTTRR